MNDNLFISELCFCTSYALSTLPLLKQEVHICIVLLPPAVLTLTDLTFGFHILFDLLCEWLTALPKCTPFPHISHFAIILAPPLRHDYAFAHGRYFNRFLWQLQVTFDKIWKQLFAIVSIKELTMLQYNETF